MKQIKLNKTEQKYFLPIHWIRPRYHKYSIVYFGYVKILKEIFSHEKRGYVLDAGCGDGRISYEIQKLGHKILGIDIFENSVMYAKILVPNADFKVVDLVNLDEDEISHKKFDFVMCVEVIEHIHPDYCSKVLKNLNGLLKSGGKLVITFPSHKIPISKLHYQHFTAEDAKSLLERSGFEIEKIIGNQKINFLSSILLSDTVWRLFWNPYCQFRFIGWIIDKVCQKYLNYSDINNAGRYIIVGAKRCQN